MNNNKIYKDYQIVNNSTNEKLEQVYLDSNLKKTGVIIDTESFPQDTPDKETCEILNDLFLKNQLISRQVKYSIIFSDDSMHMTDEFSEYNYDNRKFIRYEVEIDESNTYLSFDDNNINNFYWFEVKPYVLLKDKILYNGFGTSKSRRKM